MIFFLSVPTISAQKTGTYFPINEEVIKRREVAVTVGVVSRLEQFSFSNSQNDVIVYRSNRTIYANKLDTGDFFRRCRAFLKTDRKQMA